MSPDRLSPLPSSPRWYYETPIHERGFGLVIYYPSRQSDALYVNMEICSGYEGKSIHDLVFFVINRAVVKMSGEWTPEAFRRACDNPDGFDLKGEDMGRPLP